MSPRASRNRADTAALNASLPQELRAWVDQRVARAGFGTASEYIRSLIREDRDRATRGELIERALLDRVRRGSGSADAGARGGLAEAFDMLRLTFELMRQNLRRQHSGASDAELERRIRTWQAQDDWSQESPGHLVRSEKHLRRYLGGKP